MSMLPKTSHYMILRDGFLRDCEIRKTQQNMVVHASNPKASPGRDPVSKKQKAEMGFPPHPERRQWIEAEK